MKTKSRREVAESLHSGMVRVTKFVAMVDAECPISPSRLSILAVLHFGGDQTINDIARLERVKPPTVTNLIKALEADKYVRRKSVSNDARKSLISITKKGSVTLERARQRRLDVLEEKLKTLSGDEIKLLEKSSSILLKVADSLLS